MKLSKRLVIIAIILGIITTSGMYLYLSSLEGSKKTIAIWVAQKDIPENTKLSSSLVELKKVEEAYVHKLAITSDSKIIGKYTGTKINAGEQILSSKLIELAQTGFAYTIPKGRRAISIAVDKVAGVGERIRVGDYVDVLVFVAKYEVEDKEYKYIWPDIESLVLQNIQVLAVDGKAMVDSKDKEKDTDIKEKSLVTLAVTPAEAEKLALSDQAQIRLILRNPEDSGIVETTGAIRNDIVPNRGATILSK